MFNDKNGLGLGILGLGVVGEVMLILFVSVIVTTSVTTQLLNNEAFGSSQGEKAPVIAMKVTVGPGRSVFADGKLADFEKVLKLAAEVGKEEKVLVQIHVDGDPGLFWELRYAMKKLGHGFVEAPPVGGTGDRKERR